MYIVFFEVVASEMVVRRHFVRAGISDTTFQNFTDHFAASVALLIIYSFRFRTALPPRSFFQPKKEHFLPVTMNFGPRP